MADRGGSHTRIRRAPLGDATDRIINTSPQKYEKQGKPRNAQPNPLRAHPVSVTSTKIPSRKGATPSSTGLVSVQKRYAKPRTSAGLQSVNPGTKETSGNNRFSQISTSSGASSSNRKTHIGPWQLGKTLGKGSAARVRLARHHTTQDVVAVKILAKNMTQLTAAGSMAELDKWDRTRDEFNSQRHMPLSIEREVAVLKLIDHPHIVKLHDIWENRSEIYLVLEYMDGGDMFSYINAFGPLPEFEMVGYFRQILTALEYVHSFNICHRDLKPENILMKSNGIVKIADFGMAAIQQSPTHALRTSCGSPHYAAPELIARTRYQGDKVDIWSMGCLLYVALCRRLPFDDLDGNVPKLLAKARKGVYFVPNFLGAEARDLIAKMLNVDPAKRISIRKIWQHPLIRKYDDLDDLNDGGPAVTSRANDKSKSVPPDELDLQILRQLKSIWHTFSEKQIAMQLSNTQPNDQKLFYWLLLSYREKKLENYDADLTYSPSDYHHLRPANWKKKITTAEFPSRYGRTPSRFTVISTVPTEGSVEETDATDGGATIVSYDPYKSSRVMDNAHASHARIVVHRNGSTANNSSRSSTRRGRSGSFRSTSTRSRQARGGRRITAPAATPASRHSLSSIQSGESAPYSRPASRRKRGVNFSHVRMQSAGQCEGARAADDATYNYGYPSPTCSTGDPKFSMNPNGRSRAGTQSMVNMSKADQGTPYWNEEVREFSHSIAKDCDDAFNSSLLDPEPYLCDTPKQAPVSVDTMAPSGGLPTPISWDQRPLPPTPPTTASVAHEKMMARRRFEDKSEYNEKSIHSNYGLSQLNGVTPGTGSMAEHEPNRRIASAPIYSQYSTQWGKDKIPLPSINEKFKEEARGNDGDGHRVVSAPVWYTKEGSAHMDDHKSLEFLSQHENTIRLVTSPSAKPRMESMVPEPPNVYRHTSRGDTAHLESKQELDLRQRYMNDEPAGPSADGQEALPEDFKNTATIKKKTSWFKRLPKDREDAPNNTSESVSNQPNHLTYASSNSSTDPAISSRKKSFSLAFWRNSKDRSEMRMSRAASEMDNMFSHPTQPAYNSKYGDQTAMRNIEPQQNWLARLFRVKPATKYLCFSISRRRARQETVILLKEWRKYGIRDVEVDKKRNIVFARLGKKNYLNLKEVAFAAEIMTVIEHGKRGQLCIVRFTQERGAASSFHKVVDTMQSVFSERNLLVVEKRKTKMMIKTLNS
ncbi:hypothetical protein O1611_g4742 [Lasiodiplodia mahajangana]|uniref:Uncharacterized protein n=1 Tax=Lasiodiplodia mahajangana TaxID=1108764 RepID=A0ACC2JN89_9PEZI|nr:hypothetical protein O1611_g4742 [Lasiodiplodia mahajangana]